MLVFLYGSLRDPVLLGQIAGDPRIARTVQPATLIGWTRVHIGSWSARYASVSRARGSRVTGSVAQLTAAAQTRLIAYEGTAYDLKRVRVILNDRPRMACVWVARSRTKRLWVDPADPLRARVERSATRHA